MGICKMRLFSRIPVKVQTVLLFDFRDRRAQIAAHRLRTAADDLDETASLARALHERRHHRGHGGVVASEELDVEAFLVDGEELLQCCAV